MCQVQYYVAPHPTTYALLEISGVHPTTYNNNFFLKKPSLTERLVKSSTKYGKQR
jgi:hypothetical protein